MVTVPAAIDPPLSDTVKMQDVPAGTVLPQFPHRFESPPPRAIEAMWRSAEPTLCNVRNGATLLRLTWGALLGLILAMVVPVWLPKPAPTRMGSAGDGNPKS